ARAEALGVSLPLLARPPLVSPPPRAPLARFAVAREKRGRARLQSFSWPPARACLLPRRQVQSPGPARRAFAIFSNEPASCPTDHVCRRSDTPHVPLPSRKTTRFLPHPGPGDYHFAHPRLPWLVRRELEVCFCRSTFAK
ncbi:unnamed protein product, partial [Ixodes persulcatus]